MTATATLQLILLHFLESIILYTPQWTPTKSHQFLKFIAQVPHLIIKDVRKRLGLKKTLEFDILQKLVYLHKGN